MMHLLECDCGFVAVGPEEEVLIAAAQAHAKSVHGMDLERTALMAAMVRADHPPRRTDSAPDTGWER